MHFKWQKIFYAPEPLDKEIAELAFKLFVIFAKVKFATQEIFEFHSLCGMCHFSPNIMVVLD